MNLAELGARIRQRREQRRLRQSDVASALQISPQAVSKWERGENAPDIAVLVDLSRLLDASIEWLLGGHSGEREIFPATVLATSLQGYAERSNQLALRELATWSSSVHYAVTEAVRQHDGVPVKYVGDGFLGFFAGAGHGDRALAAARRAQAMVDHDGLAIALDSGDIFLGNIGHPDYASLDILGAPVNTAFLLLPHIADQHESRIGLTESVTELLSDRAAVQDRGAIALTGCKDPIRIFEPAGSP